MRRSGDPSVSVVVPVRNEEGTVPAVLPAIAAVRPAVREIVVVDGGSVDATIPLVRLAVPGAKIVMQTRSGKGNALACGFAAAVGQIIVTMDADGAADPAEIPELVAALVGGADFATGSRYCGAGRQLAADRAGSPGWVRADRSGDLVAELTGRGAEDGTGRVRPDTGAGGRLRRVLLHAAARIWFGAEQTDLGFPYHAFWADLLPTFDLPSIAAAGRGSAWGDGPEIDTLLSCRAAAAGRRMAEIRSVPRVPRRRPRLADDRQLLHELVTERRRNRRPAAGPARPWDPAEPADARSRRRGSG